MRCPFSRIPAGISKETNDSDLDRFLADVSPATPAQQIRFGQAVEILDDIRPLDEHSRHHTRGSAPPARHAGRASPMSAAP
ncbi:MAG: hypothetical protein V9F00_00670 [Nocardioides sp.]|jgi:hypothetical protein|nr:MAG: hypothetical protein E6Q57_06335 [Mycobacterium sp.]